MPVRTPIALILTSVLLLALVACASKTALDRYPWCFTGGFPQPTTNINRCLGDALRAEGNGELNVLHDDYRIWLKAQDDKQQVLDQRELVFSRWRKG